MCDMWYVHVHRLCVWIYNVYVFVCKTVYTYVHTVDWEIFAVKTFCSNKDWLAKMNTTPLALAKLYPGRVIYILT